jgi:hypothetical protein
MKSDVYNLKHKIEHVENLPDWYHILEDNSELWHEAKRLAKKSKEKVLIPTVVGGFPALTLMESLLAVSLTLRGFEVSFLLCDAALPACLKLEMPSIPNPADIINNVFKEKLCKSCQLTGRYLFEPLGLNIFYLSDYVSSIDRNNAALKSTNLTIEQIKDFHDDDVSIGEHAYAGTLRYFGTGSLSREPMGEGVLRRYFEASLLVSYGVKQLLSRNKFDVGCFNHGIYSPQGVIGEVLRSEKIRVVNWNVAYRKKCFIFSHEDTYHHTLMNESANLWENMSWSSSTENKIKEYLESRRTGENDWIWFHENPIEEMQKIRTQLDLDETKPIIGMLTNVMWDAQLHYPANCFPSMLDWVLETIEYFVQHPNLQLLIRIHPAEIRGTMASRQPLLREILDVYPTLASNIRVIPPESNISSYAAMELCDSAIIFGTKMGVELSAIGLPVIAAGEAWVRNKGITEDPITKNEYFKLLDCLPFRKRLSEDKERRGLKYAFHFFFRRMIPVKCLEPSNRWPPYKLDIKYLEDLMPGNDEGLDLICNGIIYGSPFIYNAEEK